jgi:hypothetical protein
MPTTTTRWLIAPVLSIAAATFPSHGDSAVTYGNWAIDSGGGVTIDVLWRSDETIAGCQFDVVGGLLDHADGGLLVEYQWSVYYSTNRLLAFAVGGGEAIPPQSQATLLTSIHLQPTANIIELTELIFADEGAQEIIVQGPGTLNICPGDCAPADGDSRVDVTDLLAVLSAWGDLGGPCDVDRSGKVDVGDILGVIAGWGNCPVTP